MLGWLWRVSVGVGATVGLTVCLMAAHAWGQEPRPGGTREQPPEPGPSPTAPSPGPPPAAYPLELLGLLAPPPQRGGVTLTPSISVSEEYNDNIFLNNRTRQWDLITGVTPAMTLYVNRRSYRLSGGVSFTGELYQRETRFNDAFKSQNFVANGFYQAAPQLALTVFDSFARGRNTSLVASQSFATGRQESWSNTFGPGMTWQMTPQSSLDLAATYGLLRFEGAGSGIDSDTYALLSSLRHVITPRLTGIIGYGFTYLDLQGGEPSRTHSPTLGFSYRLTPSLIGSANGGPAITEIGGATSLTPAVSASLVQTLRIGSASVQYTRAVGAAGGLGGTTETQTASGTLTLSTWQRGLLIVLSPVYTTAESVSRQQTGRIDVKALTLNLGVTYQVARFVNVFGGYTFFQQRTGGASSVTTEVDVDQNRVRFGLQFGYPINFD